MNRRSFLKRAGAFVAAASAPLFIPAERLEFGVPKPILTRETLLSFDGVRDTGFMTTVEGERLYVVGGEIAVDLNDFELRLSDTERAIWSDIQSKPVCKPNRPAPGEIEVMHGRIYGVTFDRVEA